MMLCAVPASAKDNEQSTGNAPPATGKKDLYEQKESTETFARVRLPLTPYSIPWLGLTMGIPPYFKVTLNAPTEDFDQKGLIWQMDKPVTEKSRASVELFRDLYDQKFFQLQDYLDDDDVTQLSGNGNEIKVTKSAIRVSGIKALSIDIVSKIQDKDAPYDVHYKFVLLRRAGHVFVWRLSANELDYAPLAPIFKQFIASIRFK
ncbi:MAG: hypothetical protein A3A86_04265 [Elusimicrobia bacterium RIFCSPLOWO2_01_FULL_60_11]|nr:MAG: hypothetical protein A3A86_04265 [Elusimicrobia bacterium RIFCSPLOWO2_01_FULL_60_11]